MFKFALAMSGIAVLVLTSALLGRVLADDGSVNSPRNPISVNDEGNGNPTPSTGPGDAAPRQPFDPDAGLPEQATPEPESVLFKSVVDEQTLTVPNNLAEPIHYDSGSGLELSVKRTGVSSAASPGKTSAPGIGVFLDTADQASTIVVDLASEEVSGFAIIEHIEGKQAPEEYRYQVDLPTGYRLVTQADGSVAMIGEDGAVEPLVSPGWAFDSNGTAVPVSYSISGSTIVMQVAHRSMSSIAYPVVADPCWKCLAKLAKGAAKTFSGVARTTSGFAITVVSARFGVAPGVAFGVREMVRGVSTAVSGVRTMAEAGRENREHRDRQPDRGRQEDQDGKKN